MEILSLDLKQKRYGWKEWFVQDPPVNVGKLQVWLDKLRSFDIDPTFEIFEIEGKAKNIDPVFVFTYLFLDKLEIERVMVTSKLMSATSDIRCFKITINKGMAC